MAPPQVIVLSFLFGCLALACGASAPDPFSEKDKTFALQLFSLENETHGSMEAKFYAVSGLSTLQALPADKSSICERLEAIPMDTLEVLYHTASLSHMLACSESSKVQPLLKSAVPKIQSLLKEASSIVEVFHGIRAISLTQAGRSIDDKVRQVAVKLLEESLKQPQVNPASTGLALTSLADLKALKVDLSGLEVTAIENAVNKLLESAKVKDDTASWTGGEASGLEITSVAICGIIQAAEAFQLTLKARKKFLQIANFLLINKGTRSPRDMAALLDSLRLLSSNSIGVPIVVSISPPVLSLSSRESLQVSLTTPLNKLVPGDVKLVRASSGSNKAVWKNEELKSGAQFNFLDANVVPGIYDVTFEVTSLEQEHLIAADVYAKQVKVTGAVTLADLELAVFEADGSRASSSRAEFPLTWASTVAASHLQKLHLTLKVQGPTGEPFQPQQALISFRHSTGVSHNFVLKAAKGGGLSFDLALLENMGKFFYLSGSYDLELLVGDATMENSSVWKVGSVDLSFPPPSEEAPKPSLLAHSGWAQDALPEVVHVMRPNDKRPPETISIGFAGLAVLPFAGLLFGVVSLGAANMRTFPTGGLESVAAAAFHLGIICLAVLCILFWLKLTLFQTLGAVIIIGAITTVAGHLTLSKLADAKVKTA